MKKKGISPVVATVLLIAMVVALGLIVFLWFRGFAQESVTKFDTNVELVCNDIDFDAAYDASTNTLSIVNTGNVPIYKMNLKTSGGGSYSTEEITGDGWNDLGLNQGDAFTQVKALPGIDEIVLIPVLLGNTKGGGKKSFICNEDQHGFLITIA